MVRAIIAIVRMRISLVMYRYLSIGIGGISLFLWYQLVVSVSVNIADTR